MKKRLGYLDIAKALCIILVVAGHFCPSTTTALWSGISAVFYSFHMPTFMFISGLLFAHTWKKQSYMSIISKKFQRLMIPYFSTSVLIIAIKMLVQGLMPVANKVTPASLVEMFWYPSAASHLWFIWVLMLLFVIAAISPSRRYRFMLTCVAAALWLLPIPAPDIFCLNMACNMAVFFMAGMMFRSLGGLRILEPSTVKDRLAAACIFPACTAVFAVLEILLFKDRLPQTLEYVVPFTGIIAVLWISRGIHAICGDKGILMTVGKCSFTIFLLHSIFVEFTKAAMSAFGFTLENHFALCLTCATAAGVIMPILVQKLVLEKSKFLACLFGVK